jgi:hypothetical protein
MARIGISTSRHVPTVRVQPRSEFLHAIGPEAAVTTLQEILGPELRQLRFWVNRVDLFADWQGWNLSLGDASRFVCRADARRTYEVAGTLTGFEFGSRTTKTFMARLYDKTADMATKDNSWWFEVWVSATWRGCPSTGSSSRSVARDCRSSTSTLQPRSSPPPAICGPTPPGNG